MTGSNKQTAKPEALIETARGVRIEDEAAWRGVKLRGSVERVGPCPRCGGDDRFSINTKKQLWNCRGCDRGGDVIDLTQWLDGSDFETAVYKLTGNPGRRATCRSGGSNAKSLARTTIAMQTAL
jgi:hypothetical protein